MGQPSIDPLGKNIEKFRDYYNAFIVVFAVFMLYIHGLTVYWNLGHTFEMNAMILPAMGLLFIYMGVLLRKAERNWFVGIRTPWTLSSDRVWRKTHEIGAKLFIASGAIALLGLFFPEYALWFILVPILFSGVYTIIYSYVEYRREKRKGLLGRKIKI